MDELCAVVVDTDLAFGLPGAKVDDGFALALALASPELDVLLVSTVAGNVEVADVTLRTTALLERLGRADVPVMVGGGPDGGAAAREIATLALARPGQVTVLALGPVTSLAAALGADPDVATGLRGFVAMGGRFRGAPEDVPEFNVRTDPWAARAVVESGLRGRYVGLDVTSRMALTPADLTRLATDGGATGRYLAGQARARLRTLAPAGATACPMHDPLAVVALTHPHLVQWQAAEVAVDTSDGASRGRTPTRLLDERAAHLATIEVAVDVDAAAAKDLVLTRLAGLP